MLLGTRWTDLVVNEIYFVKEAIEIKKKDILNWQDTKNITKLDLRRRNGMHRYEQILNWYQQTFSY
jgi:hypothetical protein